MSETNNLVYFLNSTKDILGYEDENDFKCKVKEDKDFKIKVQKLVYISKFFGWDNPYIFTMAKRGPYSVELKHAYNLEDLFENACEKIEKLNLDKLREFVETDDLLYLEAVATILYKFGKNITSIGEGECVSAIQSFKRHIPSHIIANAYDNIKNFKLDVTGHSITSQQVDDLKIEVNEEFKELDAHFDKYEGSNNKIIVQGTIDYMRIALREANLNLDDEYELLMFVKRYFKIVREIGDKTPSKGLIDLNLDDLEELFDQFQEYVSEEINIIKRIDDDDFDESLCYL